MAAFARCAIIATLIAAAPVPAAAESGIASVYRPGSIRWGGPIASNGERIDFAAMTVAHPLAAWDGPMPFGTCLLIAYRSARAYARVIDNGPHTKGRVLDLTPAVERALGFPGLGPVSFWRVAKAFCVSPAARSGISARAKHLPR